MDPNDIWARPPLIADGEPTIDRIYVAVGRALSAWERFEGHLAMIFGLVMGAPPQSDAARAAYSSIVSFNGRAEMLEASAAIYFRDKPEQALEKKLKTLLKDARRASPRRNEVAHGVAQPHSRLPRNKWDYALAPAYYSSKRDLNFKPLYLYDAEIIARFGLQFDGLCVPAIDLIGELSFRETAG